MTAAVQLAPVTEADLLRALDSIAGQLAAAGWRPDYVVGIGRGGLVPATYLSHRLRLPLLSLDLSAGVPAFGDELLPRLAELSRTARLLLLDDINDSGRTVGRLRQALEPTGEPANIRYAALINNQTAAAQVDFWGRTIDRRTDERWFVFPWEAVEAEADLRADASAHLDRASGR